MTLGWQLPFKTKGRAAVGQPLGYIAWGVPGEMLGFDKYQIILKIDLFQIKVEDTRELELKKS
jgi:hypothetical protein